MTNTGDASGGLSPLLERLERGLPTNFSVLDALKHPHITVQAARVRRMVLDLADFAISNPGQGIDTVRNEEGVAVQFWQDTNSEENPDFITVATFEEGPKGKFSSIRAIVEKCDDQGAPQDIDRYNSNDTLGTNDMSIREVVRRLKAVPTKRTPASEKRGIHLPQFMEDAYQDYRYYQIDKLSASLPNSSRVDSARLSHHVQKDRDGSVRVRIDREETPDINGRITNIDVVRDGNDGHIVSITADTTYIREEEEVHVRTYESFSAKTNSITLGEVAGWLRLVVKREGKEREKQEVLSKLAGYGVNMYFSRPTDEESESTAKIGYKKGEYTAITLAAGASTLTLGIKQRLDTQPTQITEFTFFIDGEFRSAAQYLVNEKTNEITERRDYLDIEELLKPAHALAGHLDDPIKRAQLANPDLPILDALARV